MLPRLLVVAFFGICALFLVAVAQNRYATDEFIGVARKLTVETALPSDYGPDIRFTKREVEGRQYWIFWRAQSYMLSPAMAEILACVGTTNPRAAFKGLFGDGADQDFDGKVIVLADENTTQVEALEQVGIFREELAAAIQHLQ